MCIRDSGGPFANIAHGCNSVTATKMAMKLADYAITEAGFGADLGAEKFLDIKCRMAGLHPSAVVIVATVRALKYNGGVPKADLNNENLEALEKGLPNLLKHVSNIKNVYKLPCVVAINAFPTDTKAELDLVEAKCKELGVNVAPVSYTHLILGAAPTTEEGVALVKSYQAQGILVTLVGGIIDQVAEAGMKTGANVRVIPLGKDVTSVVHVVSVAIRAALIFGNVTPGDAGTLMKYTMDRVPAFVNAFKPLDDVIVACGAGAIALGFPVVTNETENIFRVPKSLIVQEDVSKFNATSLEARDIKIKITNIDIPVAFASAFEGEIILSLIHILHN